MLARPIYLDNHATTRVDPRVVEAMLPFFSEIYGNAASTSHAFGWEAKEAVDRSRETIAAAIGATARNRLHQRGHREQQPGDSRSGRTRHAARQSPGHRGHRASRGARSDRSARPPRLRSDLLAVEQAGSPRAGWLDPQRVADALRDDTLLVSVMLANNEIGVIQPLAEIAAICRQRGVLVHCDATQAVGKMPVDVRALGVDLMSFSAHKILRPQGRGGAVGAARFAGGAAGAADRRRRPRSRACAAARSTCPASSALPGPWSCASRKWPTEAARQAALRDRLYAGLATELDGRDAQRPGAGDGRAAAGRAT